MWATSNNCSLCVIFLFDRIFTGHSCSLDYNVFLVNNSCCTSNFGKKCISTDIDLSIRTKITFSCDILKTTEYSRVHVHKNESKVIHKTELAEFLTTYEAIIFQKFFINSIVPFKMLLLTSFEPISVFKLLENGTFGRFLKNRILREL